MYLHAYDLFCSVLWFLVLKSCVEDELPLIVPLSCKSASCNVPPPQPSFQFSAAQLACTVLNLTGADYIEIVTGILGVGHIHLN